MNGGMSPKLGWVHILYLQAYAAYPILIRSVYIIPSSFLSTAPKKYAFSRVTCISQPRGSTSIRR